MTCSRPHSVGPSSVLRQEKLPRRFSPARKPSACSAMERSFGVLGRASRHRFRIFSRASQNHTCCSAQCDRERHAATKNRKPLWHGEPRLESTERHFPCLTALLSQAG